MSEDQLDKKVIGFAGRAGAGKDEAARYISKHCQAQLLSIGDIAREIAERRGMTKSRDNLHAITEEYYQEKGPSYFTQQIIKKVQSSDRNLIVISGIRSHQDDALLRERFTDSYLLAAVRVGERRIRFQRTKNRDDPRDPQTYQSFLEEDQEEEEMFNIGETLDHADIVIENSGTLEEFHRRIRKKLFEGPLSPYCGSAGKGAE